MATCNSMGISKGDSVSVSIEDVYSDIIIVKLIDDDKIFRGILLQDYQNEQGTYGVNLDRISSGSSWPAPLTPVVPNLKTIPCSVDRYSYKVEGQPSTLMNVFHADPTRRSHRNKPAPQLSRILRPRRFVCRKCKKAFHVGEHGMELSSSSLLMTDQQQQLMNFKPTFEQPSTSATSQPHIPSSSSLWTDKSNGFASIRHVTPSIIPKFNRDLTMMTMMHNLNEDEEDEEEEVHSNHQKSSVSETIDFSTDRQRGACLRNKKRRTTDFFHGSQKMKKMKLGCNKTSSNLIRNIKLNDGDGEEETTVSTTPNVAVEENQRSLRPTAVSPCESVVSSQLVRKNRIKAQYVSVASPFRQCSTNSNPVVKRPTSTNSIGIGSLSKKSDLRTNLRCRGRKREELVSDNDCSHVSVDGDDKKTKNENPVVDTSDAHCSKQATTENSKPNTMSTCLKDQRNVKAISQTEAQDASASDEAANSSSLGRRGHVDYEKPKNRWMREAHAKKNQDDRLTNGLDAAALLTSTSSQPSRLRTRSSNDSSSMNSFSDGSPSKVKCSSGDPISVNVHESNVSSDQTLSPSFLPILKIKINRNRRDLTTDSSAKLTQYELVRQKQLTTCTSPNPSSVKSSATEENPAKIHQCTLTSGVEFHVGDVVWSKLAGWPYWPAQITTIQSEANQSDADASGTTKRTSYTACLHWFAWHQVSYVPCDKLYHFVPNLRRFDNKNKRGTFRQAVNEAQQTVDMKKNNTPDQSSVIKSPDSTSVDDVVLINGRHEAPKCSLTHFEASNVEVETSVDSSTNNSGVPHQSNEEVAPNSESSGRLKIVLCTSKTGADAADVRSKKGTRNKSKETTKTKAKSRSKQAKSELVSQSDTAPMDPIQKMSTNNDTASIQSGCLNNLFGGSRSTNHQTETHDYYINPPSELLMTQFPHVFPDLKVSGILSDTVDIPTFSEDESEEDVGRLIIDSDVMASVNASLEQQQQQQQPDSHAYNIQSINVNQELLTDLKSQSSSDSFRMVSDYASRYPPSSFAQISSASSSISSESLNLSVSTNQSSTYF